MAIVYTTNLDLKQNRITNLGAPAVSSDAVTKQYVDSVASGLNWKDAVRAASTGNVSVSSPGTTIDGVTLVQNDRVLLLGQTNAVQNGIYTYTGTGLARAADADGMYDPDGDGVTNGSDLRPGSAVTVSEGTDNGNHTFVLTTDGPITVGTTPLSFSLLNAGTAQVYDANNGVQKIGSTFSAYSSNAGISVGASGIGVTTDPDGGLQVLANKGVSTRFTANPGLQADSNGLKFLPRPDAGIEVDSAGAAVKIKADVGLKVDSTGVQTVLATDKGLKVDTTGLQVKTGNGVTTDSTGVKVVADNLGGLQVGSAGIAAKLPGTSGLQQDSQGLAVKPDPDGGLQSIAAGVGVKPKPTTSGLTVDNTGVSVNLRSDDGLEVDNTGLGIKTDLGGGLQTGTIGLGIKLRPNDGLDLDNAGIGVTTNPNGGLATGDNLGLKVVPNPAVTKDAANPASIIVGANGVSVNAAFVTRKFAASVGNGTNTSIAVTHGLGTTDVKCELYEVSSGATVYAEVVRTSADVVTVTFGTAPTSGQYRIVVCG